MADNFNVVFPRTLLKKMILLYKDNPCLWDRNSLGYKLKQKRHVAMTKITELVQEYDSSATRVHILRKIESLRACVRREFRKVQESRRNATSDDEIYTPHLWYYDLFSFMFHDDESFKSKERDSPEPSANSDGEEAEYVDDDEHPFESAVGNYSMYNMSANSIEVADNNTSVSKRFSYEEDNNTNKNKRNFTEIEDEYDAIGINVAAKLRNLPPNMRILAEKLINDVMFQAQTNILTNSTALVTPDPFK